MNKIQALGNLTRAVELRYTASGTAIAKTGLAINRRRTASDGTTKEETCFVDLTIWGKSGETFAKHFDKGDGVILSGRLEYETWTAQDGGKRSKHSITVEEWHFPPSSGGGDKKKTRTKKMDF